MESRPRLSVCLTPELLHLYDLNNKVVVVVDIFRATSCMTTALAEGVQYIIPVASVEEAQEFKDSGYLIAGERNGQQIDGFDFGNSPLSYLNSNIAGHKLAMTTTNGTLAISKAQDCSMLVIGSFLNISELSSLLKSQNKDVLILCAGWKGKVNLEDTLFAGALCKKLSDDFDSGNDSVLVSKSVYDKGKDNLKSYLSLSSHYNRLKRLGISKDIDFCLEWDRYNVVPVLSDNKLLRL